MIPTRDQLQSQFTRVLTEGEFRELELLEKNAADLAQGVTDGATRLVDGGEFSLIKFPSQYLVNRVIELLKK